VLKLTQVLKHLFNHHPDKPTREEVTEVKQKIKLKPELTGSEGILYIYSH
jgi:hypothetical protein